MRDLYFLSLQQRYALMLQLILRSINSDVSHPLGADWFNIKRSIILVTWEL